MQVVSLNVHGHTVAQAMRLFIDRYNRLAASGPGFALEVIHGKGSVDAGSVIRDTLRDYLRTEGKRIRGFDAQLALRGADYLFDGCGTLAYMHGEDIDRNGGKTVVVPRQKLRPPLEWRGYR